MLRNHLTCTLILLFAPAAALASPAEQKPNGAPVVLNADQVSYDQNAEIATAQGHVEVAQGDRVLRADRIVYEKKRDVVTAWGHVALIEKDGQVSFADKAEVSSDFKQGFIDQIGMMSGANFLGSGGSKNAIC